MMRVSGEMGGGGSREAEKSPEEIMDIVESAGEEAQRKAFKMAYPDQEFNLASIYNGDYDDTVIKNIYDKLKEMSAGQSAGPEGGSAGPEGGSAGPEGGSAGEAPRQGGGSAEGEPAQAAPAEGNPGHGEARGDAQRSRTFGSKLLRAAMVAGAGLLLTGSGIAVHNAMNVGTTVAGAGEAVGDEADTSSEDDASVVSEAMGAATESVQDAADSIAENVKTGAEDEDSAEKEAMEFWLGHYAGHYAGEDGTGTNPDKLKSVNIDKPLEYETLDEATDLLIKQFEDQPASLAVTSFCLLHELGAEGVDEKGMNGVLEDLENDGLHKDLLDIVTKAMKEAAQDKDKERVRKIHLSDGQYANVYFTDTADGEQVTSENIVINHCETHENGTPAIAYDMVLDRDAVVPVLEKYGIKFEDSASGGKVEFTLVFKEECTQLVIKKDSRDYEVVVKTTPELPQEKKKELDPKQPVPNPEEELESKKEFDEYTTLDESAHTAGDKNETKKWEQNLTGDGSAKVAATDHDTTENMDGAGGTGVGEQEAAPAPKSEEAEQANEEFGDQGGEDDDSDSDSGRSDDGGSESSGGGGGQSSGGGGGGNSGGGGKSSGGGGGGNSGGGGGKNSGGGGGGNSGGGGGKNSGGGGGNSGGGAASQKRADDSGSKANRAIESQPDVQDLSDMSMDDI